MRLVLLCSVLLLALAACGDDDPSSTLITVRIEHGAPLPMGTVLEVDVWHDGSLELIHEIRRQDPTLPATLAVNPSTDLSDTVFAEARLIGNGQTRTLRRSADFVEGLNTILLLDFEPAPDQDAAVSDAAVMDAGPSDAGPIDAGPIDAGPIDAGPIDAGPIDAGPIDAGPIDAGPIDAGLPSCILSDSAGRPIEAVAIAASPGHNAVSIPENQLLVATTDSLFLFSPGPDGCFEGRRISDAMAPAELHFNATNGRSAFAMAAVPTIRIGDIAASRVNLDGFGAPAESLVIGAVFDPSRTNYVLANNGDDFTIYWRGGGGWNRHESRSDQTAWDAFEDHSLIFDRRDSRITRFTGDLDIGISLRFRTTSSTIVSTMGRNFVAGALGDDTATVAEPNQSEVLHCVRPRGSSSWNCAPEPLPGRTVADLRQGELDGGFERWAVLGTLGGELVAFHNNERSTATLPLAGAIRRTVTIATLSNGVAYTDTDGHVRVVSRE